MTRHSLFIYFQIVKLPWMDYNSSARLVRVREQQVPEKYELNNQEFLTFRNNPTTQNTGRSVFSQPFDYRSLGKYQKIEESSDQPYNFRKNLKNLRSQDKYKQLREENRLFLLEQNSENHQGKSSQRNEQLKSKLLMMKKKLKQQTKRSILLQKGLIMIQNEMVEIQELLTKIQDDKQYLEQILGENQNHTLLITRKLQQMCEQEKRLTTQLEYLQATFQGEVRSGRDQHSTIDFQKKLMGGIKQLEAVREQMEDKIVFFEQQIEKMEENLQELANIDRLLRGQLSH